MCVYVCVGGRARYSLISYKTVFWVFKGVISYSLSPSASFPIFLSKHTHTHTLTHLLILPIICR